MPRQDSAKFRTANKYGRKKRQNKSYGNLNKQTEEAVVSNFQY